MLKLTSQLITIGSARNKLKKLFTAELLGIKANSHYLRQVTFMQSKLPSRAAAALA